MTLGLVGAALVVVGMVGCAHRASPTAAAPAKGAPEQVAPEKVAAEKPSETPTPDTSTADTPTPDSSTPDKLEVGTVELSIAAGPSTANFQRPGVVGGGGGAKQGAILGGVAPAAVGLLATLDAAKRASPYGIIAGLFLTGAGIAVAPLGAGVGAAIGAMTAPSEKEVEHCAAALSQAWNDANFAKALAAWIIDAAGSRPIVAAGDSAGAAADTRLQIDAPAVSLASKDPTDWKPWLQLRASIGAKLVRASDGQLLREFTWSHEGPRATFFEWGKDDARMLRAELERAGRALAAKVVAELW